MFELVLKYTMILNSEFERVWPTKDISFEHFNNIVHILPCVKKKYKRNNA